MRLDLAVNEVFPAFVALVRDRTGIPAAISYQIRPDEPRPEGFQSGVIPHPAGDGPHEPRHALHAGVKSSGKTSILV